MGNFQRMRFELVAERNFAEGENRNFILTNYWKQHQKELSGADSFANTDDSEEIYTARWNTMQYLQKQEEKTKISL
jgi:hypothetical protein